MRPGRAELARLAAARGVEHTDVIRLGSVAIAVLAERGAYRDAVLAQKEDRRWQQNEPNIVTTASVT